MKKVLLAVFAIGMAASSAFSQIQLGVRGGLNTSTFVGSDASDQNFKLGPHVGGFLRFNSDGKVMFQPEVLYSMKGSSTEYSFLGWSVKSSTRLSYIDVPLMAGIKPVESFGILLGIQPSVLLAAKNTVEVNGSKDSETGTDGLAKFDFGLVGGLQYQSKAGLDFGLRANYGVTSLDEDYEGSLHNLNLMVTVGFAFGGR